MKDKKTFGIYLDEAVIGDMEQAMQRTNCSSRNEFIVEAIRFYIAHLQRRDYSDILTPAYESVINARIADTEERIARVIFKQAVELSMMMHVVAATNDISENKLGELRRQCVAELSRINGACKFEDAVRYQKGG